jgi:hypothetical protein
VLGILEQQISLSNRQLWVSVRIVVVDVVIVVVVVGGFVPQSHGLSGCVLKLKSV